MADDASVIIRVAIDGPAASGKSAAGSAVAARLGIPFIDTGVMYRALTWLARERGVAVDDATGLTALAAHTTLEIGTAGAGDHGYNSVQIDGLDATPHLRDAGVEQNVSLVSAVAAVRERMVALQRQLARGPVVMAGRDIGTVVLPDAELKVFLDASVEERARRRLRELQALGAPARYEALIEEMRRRDRLDSTRAVAPLRPADGAVRLNTDGLDLETVIERVLALAEARKSERP